MLYLKLLVAISQLQRIISRWMTVYAQDPDMNPESSAPLYIDYMYHLYVFLIFLILFHWKHPNFLFWTSTLDPENTP